MVSQISEMNGKLLEVLNVRYVTLKNIKNVRYGRCNLRPAGPAQVLFASQRRKLTEIVKKSLVSTSNGTSTLLAKLLRAPMKLIDAFVSFQNGRFGKDSGEDRV